MNGILKLYYTGIKLYLSLFIICIIIFTVFKLITVTSIINNINIKIDLIGDQKLLYTLIKIGLLSFIYISINLVLYKYYFVNKIYNKYYDTYLKIKELDTIINNTEIDNPNNINVKSDSKEDIEKKVIEYINNNNNILTKEKKIKLILLYCCIVKHIKKENNNDNDNENLRKYIDTICKGNEISYEAITLYSLLSNKNRKEPIKYYILNNKIILEDADANYIIREVNKRIKEINDKINEINLLFEDDNYIINLGWYFLISLIISSLYITALIIIIYSKYDEIKDFKNFININIPNDNN